MNLLISWSNRVDNEYRIWIKKYLIEKSHVVIYCCIFFNQPQNLLACNNKHVFSCPWLSGQLGFSSSKLGSGDNFASGCESDWIWLLAAGWARFCSICVHSGIQADRAAGPGGAHDAHLQNHISSLRLWHVSYHSTGQSKSQSQRAGKYSSPTLRSWQMFGCVIPLQGSEELWEIQSTTGWMISNHSH